ncbi:MAG: glycoside hydrolase domain-containing protein [Terracoccus sp.]
MSQFRWPTRLRVVIVATAFLVVAGFVQEVPADAASTPVPALQAPQAATNAATKQVVYHGVAVQVPSDWPVVDLTRRAHACARLDRSVVYLGAAPEQQDCPAHLVGRANTLWLQPASTSRQPASMAGRPLVSAHVGALSARVARSAIGHQSLAVLDGGHVQVGSTWAGSSAIVDAAWATARPVTGLPDTVGAVPPALTGPSAPIKPQGDHPAISSSAVPSATTFNGMGFDTCAAPSSSTMTSWLSSPYRAVGIYIGGSMRACGDGNLSASWAQQVTQRGWGLIPIYVAEQAPCVDQTNLARIDPAKATQQGVADASDAVAQAQRFGLGSGSAIFYDMEGYNEQATDAQTCRTAVLNFLSAWTSRLHAQGYRSGVYGSPASVMTDMSQQMRAHTSFVVPDQVWSARWDGLQNVNEQYAVPTFYDSYWAQHQRMHQYLGGVNETWGGVTLNIDPDWADATLPGAPTYVSYGANETGPGGSGFVFTGPMQYWTPHPGSGAAGMAYSTLSSLVGHEVNGATWARTLPVGAYDVQVNVPAGGGYNSPARYVVTDSHGSTTTTLNLGAGSGWRSLGVLHNDRTTLTTVHLSDNTGSSSKTVLVADAVRFQLVGTAPGAPTGVTATPDAGQVHLRWGPAPSHGVSVSGYVVTASPGGRSVSVTGTSATMTGLSPSTVYTFVVSPGSAAGPGAASAPSNAALPLPAGRFQPVAATRIMDTRYGTVANSSRVALAPGASRAVQVAGVVGSPVPSGATAATVNITVPDPGGPGYLTASTGTGDQPSVLNLVSGRTVANLATAVLNSSGTVVITNHSSRPVDLVIDVQGFMSSSSGQQWNGTNPTRLLDTRLGATANPRRTLVGPWQTVAVRVAGVAGSPVPAGATGAMLNLTVTHPTDTGYLTLDGTRTSALNFTTDRTVANLGLVALPIGGTVLVTNRSPGSVQIIADVQGYTASTGRTWMPVTPIRLADTRFGTPANAVSAPLGSGASITVRVAGSVGSPIPSSATSVALNVTAVGPRSSGYLGNGSVSVVNFTDTTVANLTISPLHDGSVTLTNRSHDPVDVVVDVQGYAS